MPNRPVIAYMEGDPTSLSSVKGNSERDALIHVLNNDLNCDVWQYGHFWDFEEDFERISKYIHSKILVLVILKQDKYGEDHVEAIEMVRSRISPSLPIVIIPEEWKEKWFQAPVNDSNVTVIARSDPEFFGMVQKAKEYWQPPLNWWGAETKRDQDILSRNLQQAYSTHYVYPDDEKLLAVPDYNHMVVAEALRIKILPIQCVKQEFDDTLKTFKGDLCRVEEDVYLQDLEKIRAFNHVHRKEFSHMLMRIRGYEPAEGGGVFVREVSCGYDVSGFAIDANTLESLLVSQFGFHAMASEYLHERIVSIEAIRKGKHRFNMSEDEESSIKWWQRCIYGLLFHKPLGFSTPIVQLSWARGGVDESHVSRVSRFLVSERKMIPVDHEGNLLPGI